MSRIRRLFTTNLKREISPLVSQTVCEVAAWCLHPPLSGDSLRSAALDPSAILRIPSFSESSDSIEEWIEKKRDCYRRAISWINQTRSEFLKAAGVEVSGACDFQSKGRLLLYEPWETVSDGAAEAGSMGFFDLKDAPPWDTWFLFDNHSVFCFVPESAITRAQNGIDANPVDCIHWADWAELESAGV